MPNGIKKSPYDYEFFSDYGLLCTGAFAGLMSTAPNRDST